MNKLVKKISVIMMMLMMVSLFHYKSEAQDVALKVSAPRVVEAGEQFRLSFSVNGKGKDFKAPDFKGFTILTGPNVSSSSSVQFVNGKMSQSSNYSYNYILVAYQPGKFDINPATVKVKGKSYQSKVLNIEVIEGKVKNKQNTTQKTTINASEIEGKELFATLTVDKKNVYQGEKIIATIKIYTRVNIGGFETYKFPPFSGFWSQDIESPSQLSFHRENVNGSIYEAAVLKKSLIVPQRSGKLVIDPFTATVQVRKQVRSSNPFDDFFGGSYQNIPVEITTKPITVQVKPLPENNKPQNFYGAVGNFKLSSSIDKTEVKANEAVNLKLNIEGNGNFKFITAPKVDFPPDIEVYDPKKTENTKVSAQGIFGKVSFNYLFIPRYAGTYRIAPIAFSYFDFNTKSYKTLTTKEYIINVEKGSGEQEMSSGVVQSFSKEDVKLLGKDIRFIKTNFDVSKKQTYFFGTSIFYLLYAIPFALFLIIILIRRTQIKQNANQAKVKNKKANKLSRKRLKKAAAFMKQNNKEAFFDELLRAIWGYLSDKLSIPLAELSKDNVAEILDKHKVDEQAIEELKELLNTCEYARYAPSNEANKMENVYSETGSVIAKLEQKIKHKAV